MRDIVGAAALKLASTRKALLMLAGDPYGENGDFFARDVYDTLPLNAIKTKFFSAGESSTKGRHLTNLEGSGQLPEGQAFVSQHCAIRIMPISTGLLTDGDSNATMAALLYDLQMIYFEPTLSGKEFMGAMSFMSFMPTFNVRPAAGAVGVWPGILMNESWRYLDVPYQVPQLTQHGVNMVKGDGVDWAASVKNKFQIQWIWRTIFARKT